MRMHNAARPGEMVKNTIEALEVTVTDAAKHVGVSRQTLNNLINQESSCVSPEMALRLEAVFGGAADNWLRMQAVYDAIHVRRRVHNITRDLKPLGTA
ncbi:HigA family addiction module antitoxin [Algimonas porphyrae]|uniref:Transcriptional regulator n=1 Tax=Algimonas porphyrae TaxID=1128113 RepID=A0ABQ5UZZ2_9PROT|nr:HigA family addiction module antitoxin [Algimonas porphyrae]GLQ20869.1 transcriptional regulator [Algimonas porphyrae]